MRSCRRRLMLHSLHRGLRGGLSAPIGQVMGRTENGPPKGEQCDPWDICVCPHSVVLSREPCIVIRGQGPIGLLGAWTRALVGTGALRRATKGPVRVLTSGSSQSGSIRVRGIRSRRVSVPCDIAQSARARNVRRSRCLNATTKTTRNGLNGTAREASHGNE